MSDLGHFVDDRSNQIFKLTAKLKGAEAEVERLKAESEARGKFISNLQHSLFDAEESCNAWKSKAEAFGNVLYEIAHAPLGEEDKMAEIAKSVLSRFGEDSK